jgi:hypothetical protein
LSLPIIFVHTGDSWYLKYALRQMRFYNPDAQIYLLGDSTNNHYPFVTHIDYVEYRKDSRQFSDVYVHMNTNSYDYELFCFERWFIIKEFTVSKGINSFCYFDSDVLVYAELLSLTDDFEGCLIANTGEGMGMPAFTYFKNANSITIVCDYFLQSYLDEGLFGRIKEFWNDYRKIGNSGGVCDMTIFDFFHKDNPDKLKKIDRIKDYAFDVNIAITGGYESKNNIKKVYWINDLPYCKSLADGELINFKTLHFQGTSKRLIRKYYKADGYQFQKIAEPIISYFFRSIVHRMARMKKLLTNNTKL